MVEQPDAQATATATPRSSGLFTVRKTRPPIFAPLTSTLSSLTRSGQQPSSSTPSPAPLPSSSPSPSATPPSSKLAPTPNAPPPSSCQTPPVLPRRPKMDTTLPNFPWRGETLDTSGESGYSTDNSDKESLRP